MDIFKFIFQWELEENEKNMKRVRSKHSEGWSIKVLSIFQPLLHGLDATQGQFQSKVQTFTSSRLVAIPRLKIVQSVLFFFYPLLEEEQMDSCLSRGGKLTCKQLCSEFEYGLLSPFPRAITLFWVNYI